ncbi:MAG: hypothetical protein ACOC8A_02545 [bacterium]
MLTPRPADVAGIEECLARLGQLASDFERDAELETNSLIVGRQGEGSIVADVWGRLTG